MRRETLAKTLAVVTGLVLMSAPVVWAGHCQSDFDCDGNVYPSDLSVFLDEYGKTDCTSCPSQTLCQGTLSALGRWCDQGDGTVKDMTTGLVWLQDASCMGQMDWYNAIMQPVTNLRSGDCSGTLADGSVWGDWRMPKKSELEGITVGVESIRSSQMYHFNGVQPDLYWTSSSLNFYFYEIWTVHLHDEYVGTYIWPDPLFMGPLIWPVRSDN